MNLPKFSVDNSVCVNLLMVGILVMGVMSYLYMMPKEIFPEFSENVITITTVYPGASAREIENNVTIKIEDAIQDLDDLDEIFSTSQEGVSTVVLTISPEADDLARRINDVQQAIDQIDDFPDDAEEPLVREVESNVPIITVSLYGDINLLHLKELVDDLKDAVQSVSGVAEVRVSGLPEREIWVEIRPEALTRYGVSMTEVSRAIEERNLDLPGGALPTDEGEFLLRTVGKAQGAPALEELPVKTTASGGQVRLGDVAEVSDWFERETTLGRYNMRRAINLTVTKTRQGDAIQLSEDIRRLVQDYRERLPATVDLGVFNDTSVYIENRLSTLQTSGMQGLLVVFGFLFLMLATRTAIMVTLGIPISFLGAIVIMSFTGMTMNMIAMFALIVVLGLVVDDAVVMGENIYRHYQDGLSPREAAIKGANEVAWPVIAAVSTTIAAFMPLLLIPGPMGVFLGVIPKVVTYALLVSLFEALVILPSHMAEFLPATPPPPSPFRQRVDAAIERFTGVYGRLADRALEWRYVFMTGAFGFTAVLVTYAVIHIPFQLFHDFEAAQFFVNIEAPPAHNLQETEALVKSVEKAVAAGLEEGELTSLTANVGFVMDDFDTLRQGENLAQLIVELTDLGQGRARTTSVVMEAVREKIDPLRPQGTITLKEVGAGPGGAPVYVLITGPDIGVLREASTEVKAFIRGLPGTSDVKDNLEAGKPELQVRLRPAGYALGLTDAVVAQELRAAFWGVESSTFQTEDEDIDIRVKLPEGEKTQVEALLSYQLTLPARPGAMDELGTMGEPGAKVQLSEVAEVVKARGVSRIVRQDRERAVTITGELDQAQTTSQEVSRAVQSAFADFGERYPGYALTTEKGEVADINESLGALYSAFALAMIVIYFILGAQFRSYVQPLVVMAAIPFGIDGVILGHMVMGKSLGLMSMIGLVALSGIVVNDSLVLVDFVNKRRAEGAPRRSSLVEAGMLRLRPVLLTSLTTMGGLFFLAFLATGQAKFLSPMAVAIFFGLMFATVITLFIVPCLYAVLDDAVLGISRLRSRLWAARQ